MIKGFPRGTLTITNNNSFSTWMGWYVGYDEKFYIIAEEAQVEDISRKLLRIGLDNLSRYITPAQLNAYEGGKLKSYAPIDFETAQQKIAEGKVQIVDLRAASEFQKGHIEGAEHIFVGKLTQNLDKISKDKPVIIHCQSGARSAIGYSILAANGFDNIHNYAGGWAEWFQKETEPVNS